MIARRLAALMLLAIVGIAGCRWPWEPKSGPIVGSVRYPGGAPVWGAMVVVVNGDTTFTGTDGRFFLPVPSGRDTVVVWARDGYTPGTSYAETRSGHVHVPVTREVIVVRIVLTEVTPI